VKLPQPTTNDIGVALGIAYLHREEAELQEPIMPMLFATIGISKNSKIDQTTVNLELQATFAVKS
jgi:hypothetical protein